MNVSKLICLSPSLSSSIVFGARSRQWLPRSRAHRSCSCAEKGHQWTHTGLRVPRTQDHHPEQWVMIIELFVESVLFTCWNHVKWWWNESFFLISLCATQRQTWSLMKSCGGTTECTSVPLMHPETRRGTQTGRSDSLCTVSNSRGR